MEEFKKRIEERYLLIKRWCRDHKEGLKTTGLIAAGLWILRLLRVVGKLRNENDDLDDLNIDLSIRNEIYEDLLKGSIKEYHEKHNSEE